MQYSEFYENTKIIGHSIDNFEYEKYIEPVYMNSYATKDRFCHIFRKLYIKNVAINVIDIIQSNHATDEINNIHNLLEKGFIYEFERLFNEY